MKNEKILAKHGWFIECESPFSIKNENGSIATGEAAYIILGEFAKQQKKEKTTLEKNLKNWDVYEAPNGNIFIKFGNTYAIAIGSLDIKEPEKSHGVLVLPCVLNSSDSLEVKKIGKLKLKK